MFRRKRYDDLLEWKSTSNGKSAVLVEGARRVGKTTLVQGFASAEYADSIYIDFSKAPKAVLDLFLNEREDVDTFLRMLQLHYAKKLPERKSVIIFDEVQRFPVAREYVKHLVADGRFDYIETGSLISIRKNVDDIVIPSEEERLSLHPLDFDEYLWALGLDAYIDAVRDAFERRVPLPDLVHAKIMRLFNEYMLVGGMPQSVEAFAESKDFGPCDRVKRNILNLYLEDIGKFGGSEARRARALFQEVPGQLSAASKRFKFASARKGPEGGGTGRFEEYEPAIDWLEDAHLVNPCRLCTDPSVGLRLSEKASSLKLYMADTGLLVTLAFADGPRSMEVHRDIQFGRVSVNRGMLAENVVAQQLRSHGHALFYHAWEEPGQREGARPRPREIDFLVTRPYEDAAGKLRVSPVEVKSSKSYSTVSLDDFKRKYAKRAGSEIVLHPKQLRVDGDRMYLPLYMAGLL
ncbi:ATP-binding protein [Xiamenia xianingshaonis]|uniref:AAA family ATPase n=1 Tax=Xiamenia xianingshaonis TaxID=2682776 RepID=A0ABX0INM3_9ACTN|nr:AAA family ATPase [Xiamenia xianingshaonis]NHM14743.1 AAA family ATPase [Xiamenia xianingshaonis]